MLQGDNMQHVFFFFFFSMLLKGLLFTEISLEL